MIKQVTITDRTNLPLRHSADVDALWNGRVFEFTKGVNVIIGKNGSGKTTLLRNMAKYLLCADSLYSRLPNLSGFGEALKMDDLFDKDNHMKDGMKVACDYAGVVYNYVETGDAASEHVLDSFDGFSYFMGSRSMSAGERTKSNLCSLMETAFRNKDIYFPIGKIKKEMDGCNGVWHERFDSMLRYYKENAVSFNDVNDFAYTFLLDEPDKTMDVTNIGELYGMLSYEKEMTQLICVVHNPVLIYRLSLLPHVNFIEMTDGYLEGIKKVFRELAEERRGA